VGEAVRADRTTLSQGGQRAATLGATWVGFWVGKMLIGGHSLPTVLELLRRGRRRRTIEGLDQVAQVLLHNRDVVTIRLYQPSPGNAGGRQAGRIRATSGAPEAHGLGRLITANLANERHKSKRIEFD
jgi:hypothetical protein